MTRIEIPFREEFREAMLSDRKLLTSRNKKYGDAGDRFSIFGAEFELVWVRRLPLGTVADRMWTGEGVSSAQEFIEIWNELHPRKGFDPSQRVWVHHFARVIDPNEWKLAREARFAARSAREP